MRKQSTTANRKTDSLANQMPILGRTTHQPEGALIAESTSQNGGIAVLYNLGERTPEITIKKTSDHIQTVFANGVAVAIVARADGPKLTNTDVLLVERFVSNAN